MRRIAYVGLAYTDDVRPLVMRMNRTGLIICNTLMLIVQEALNSGQISPRILGCIMAGAYLG